MVLVPVILAGAASPALAAFPGQNGRIAFLSDRDGDEDINTIRADRAGTPINLTNDSPGSDRYPGWSADGRRIVFMSNRTTPANPTSDFELFVMNADGTNPTQITFNTLDDEDPAWSPSGRHIVFARDFNAVSGEGDYDILTIRANGRGERNLTNSPGPWDVVPNWSPDGRRIVFASDRDGDNEIYAMHWRGSQVMKLTDNAAIEDYPNYSPDGRHIAFVSTRDDDKFEIYRMRSDGTRPRRLTVTTGDYGNGLPAWSPDGRLIVFNSTRAGSPDVFTMRAADGGDQRNVDPNPAFDYTPDWQPLRGRHHGDHPSGGKR